MKAALDYGWRLFATGMSFVAFGICGLLFSVLIFPLTWILPRRAFSQRLTVLAIHGFFKLLVAVLQKMGVMVLDVSGEAALRSSAASIVVANHPTYLDVMVLLSLTPSACCVVKSAHWGNPCFWGIVRAAEYVSNADPHKLVDAGAKQVTAGYKMIIFPEGTRSPESNRLHAFSRGFAHMAIKTQAPILPVLMSCDPPAFTKQMRWYHIPSRPFRIRVNVLAPIFPASHTERCQSPAIAARTLTNVVEQHINQRLFEYGFFET